MFVKFHVNFERTIFVVYYTHRSYYSHAHRMRVQTRLAAHSKRCIWWNDNDESVIHNNNGAQVECQWVCARQYTIQRNSYERTDSMWSDNRMAKALTWRNWQSIRYDLKTKQKNYFSKAVNKRIISFKSDIYFWVFSLLDFRCSHHCSTRNSICIRLFFRLLFIIYSDY